MIVPMSIESVLSEPIKVLNGYINKQKRAANAPGIESTKTTSLPPTSWRASTLPELEFVAALFNVVVCELLLAILAVAVALVDGVAANFAANQSGYRLPRH